MLNINTYPYELPLTLVESPLLTLEKALADRLGYQTVILLDSVKHAFDLALSELKPERGVLCSPNAPIAFYNAVHKWDLKSDYYDLNLDGTLEPRRLHRFTTEATSALLLSHNHGILSDQDAAAAFSKEHGLMLIEDATQIFGTKTKSSADLVIYSLESLVPLRMAKGAFIATDDVRLAEVLRTKAQGSKVATKLWNYDLLNHEENIMLAPLTANAALGALQHLDVQLRRISEIQNIYLDRLSSNRLIELPKAETLMAYPRFPIFLTPALFCPKENIYQALLDAKIDVQVGNKPIYKTTAYKDEKCSLFGAEEVFKAQLLLPSHHLMSDEDVDYVIETLEKVLETYGYRGCSF